MAPVQRPRCLLLEMPPEVIVMIYEELAKFQPRTQPCISTARNRPFFVDYYGAIAGTNHQVRQESLPILLQGVKLCVHVDTLLRKPKASREILLMQDTSMLQDISSYSFSLSNNCICNLDIDLGNAEQPVTKESRDTPCKPGYCVKESLPAVPAASLVKRLEVTRGGHRVMTEKILEGLVELLCAYASMFKSIGCGVDRRMLRSTSVEN